MVNARETIASTGLDNSHDARPSSLAGGTRLPSRRARSLASLTSPGGRGQRVVAAPDNRAAQARARLAEARPLTRSGHTGTRPAAFELLSREADSEQPASLPRLSRSTARLHSPRRGRGLKSLARRPVTVDRLHTGNLSLLLCIAQAAALGRLHSHGPGRGPAPFGLALPPYPCVRVLPTN